MPDRHCTTRPGLRRYAFGWDLGTMNGHRVVSKGGNNPGTNAHLRILPDDGVVITAMRNREYGGHNPAALAAPSGSLLS